MTARTLSPENTGEVRRPARLVTEGETTDLTRFYEAPSPSPLPRPEAETAVITLPPMPPREFVLMPDPLTDGRDIPPPPYPVPLPPPPTSNLKRIMRSGEFPTVSPASPLGEYGERRSVPYVRPASATPGRGRHRRPTLWTRLLGGAR